MPRTVVAAVFVAVMAAAVHQAAASAGAQPDTAARLRALETTWMQAIRNRDIATLDRLLAKDFVHVTYRGQMLSRAEALRGSVAPPDVGQTLSDEQVRVHGDTGIVTGLNTITTAEGAVVMRLRFIDVFVRIDGRWQAVSAQETAES